MKVRWCPELDRFGSFTGIRFDEPSKSRASKGLGRNLSNTVQRKGRWQGEREKTHAQTERRHEKSPQRTDRCRDPRTACLRRKEHGALAVGFSLWLSFETG